MNRLRCFASTVGRASRARYYSSDALAVPWYLRTDVKATVPDTAPVLKPDIPSHAPPHVAEMIELLADSYGMEDIVLFSVRDLPEDHDFKLKQTDVDFVILCSGRSEKHLFKAGNELRTHLKHSCGSAPAIEGIVSSALSPALRRRLIKRARKGPMATDNHYGRTPNSWVLMHQDRVDVHMLTLERRTELNLELLFCKPEDTPKYTPTASQREPSDDIFSGIRRYHTLRQLPRYLSTRAHDEQFQKAREAHMADPESVSLASVEEQLLEKYADVSLALDRSVDFGAEKAKDVVEYMRLLLDSPALPSDSKESVDAKLEKLAGFVRHIYAFSNDRFSFSEPLFIPLLWRMAYIEHGKAITPALVDDIILKNAPMTPLESSTLIAGNRARDVQFLIRHYTEHIEPGTELSPSFKELVLFTYGNAGKWDAFWEQWDTNAFLSSATPSEKMTQWVRLCVYLRLANNRAQMLFFFNNLFDASSNVSGSLVDAYGAGCTNDEKQALKQALTEMVDQLEPEGKWLQNVRRFAAAL